MRLSAVAEEFLKDARLTKSRNTIRAYSLDLARIVKYAPIDSHKSFNAVLVGKVLAELVSRKRKPNTKARYMSTMREFSKWGVRKDIWPKDCTDDPVLNVKGQAKLPKPLEAHEVKKLLALELDPLETAVRAVLYWTGLRVTPIADLLVGNVTFDPPRITSIGKGDKEHSLPMTPELTATLTKYLNQFPGKPYERLLRDRKGRPMNQRRIQRMVRKWAARAGVSGVTPHRFRHTAATEMLERNVNPAVVQKFLNHANITTTMGYVRVRDAMLTDAVMRRSATNIVTTPLPDKSFSEPGPRVNLEEDES